MSCSFNWKRTYDDVMPHPSASKTLYNETDATYVKVNRLSWQLSTIDVACGLLAPLVISPLIAVVDSSIINSVNGDKMPIKQYMRVNGMRLFSFNNFLLRSAQMRKITLLCWMVYGGTYATNNLVQSVCERYRATYEAEIRVSFALAANVGLTVIKDKRMIELFSSMNKGKQMPTPYRSLAFIMARDTLTILAAFKLSDQAAKVIQGQTGWTQKVTEKLGAMTVPAALQTVSTVLHLYALEYKADTTRNMSQMATAIGANYKDAVFGRVCRIVPAIGIGSSINKDLRDYALRTADRAGFI
jgi:hypothetical protein